MDTLTSRVRLGLLAHGLNMKALAERVGVSQQVLSNVVHGHVKDSRHHAAIAQALDCDEAWLVMGVGPAPVWYSRPQTQTMEPTGSQDQTPEGRVRRAELLADALLAKLEGLSEENATLRARLAAREAGRRSRRRTR